MIKKNLFCKTIIILLCLLLLLSVIFIALYNGAVINPAFAAVAKEIYYADDGYFGSSESTLQTETFAYSTSKIVESNLVNNTFPAYYNLNNALSNACANVAGANIIGYYDRYYENLIPDYVPGIARGKSYSYYAMETNSAKKQEVINELYIRMDTNLYQAGTSQSDYKNGLTSYINSKGRSVTFSSIMTNSHLDISKLNQAINNGDPVTLYLSGYNISKLIDENGNVTIAKSIYTGNHMVVVYGYKTIEYYNSSNLLIVAKTYLYIATGINDTGYYILDNNGTINDAEAVNIS